MDDDSEHKVDDLEDGDGCFTLNKLGRRRMKLCQSDGNTAMLTVKMWAFLSGSSCAIPTLLLLSPILLGLGDATNSELGSTERVKYALT